MSTSLLDRLSYILVNVLAMECVNARLVPKVMHLLQKQPLLDGHKRVASFKMGLKNMAGL